MVRFFILCTFLLLPGIASAEDPLADLEKTVSQRSSLRPGLENYSAQLVSDQIPEVFQRVVEKNPNQIPPSSAPELIRYWMRGKTALVAVRDNSINDIAQKTADYFSEQLASGMDWPLVPEGRTEQRREITSKAVVKSSETLFGETLLKRIELTFEAPTSLKEAFYAQSFPLPQDGIVNLYIDLDSVTNTIQELGLLTSDGLKLTTEMRYAQVPGGHLLERVKITSPDGSIDDLVEIAYEKTEGFDLPVSFSQSVRRPSRQGDLLVTFEDFKVNQSFAEEILTRFEQQQ